MQRGQPRQCTEGAHSKKGKQASVLSAEGQGGRGCAVLLKVCCVDLWTVTIL